MRTNDEIIKDIEKILEENIQPQVQMHGGHVSLQSYKDPQLKIFVPDRRGPVHFF